MNHLLRLLTASLLLLCLSANVGHAQDPRLGAPPAEPRPDHPDEHPTEEVFTVVEDMPSFPGCGDLPTNDERRSCTEKSLLKFIAKSVRYPANARQNGTEGLVVISFIVDANGYITIARVLKDIGDGCGDEVVRVVNQMNNLPQRWKPGHQRNQAVAVRYNLPFRFKLASQATEKN